VSVAYSGRAPGRATLALAREAALTALELDAGDSDPYVALAEVQRLLDLDWPLAEASYRKAVALAPSCEAARRGLAVSLASMSRFAEAKTEAEHARNLDPLCFSVNVSAAWVRYAAGEFDEAIDRCRYTLDMDPAFEPARRMLGAAYLASGQTEQAIHELQAAVGLDADDPKSLAWLAHAKAIAGLGGEALALTQKIEALAQKGYVPAYHLALAHTGLGNADTALALLEKACDDRDPAVINGIIVEPRLEPLRRDARYGALLRRLKLPH
jgi:tetratricopeptide (TPR) repeat protein